MKNQRFIFLLLASIFTVSCSLVPSKHIIGAVEIVQIQGLSYRARIDTGADITSLNAYNFAVKGDVKSVNANIGKMLRFSTANEKGESQTIETKIVKINNVQSAFGKESRYVVQLAIGWGNYVKVVEVNLRNRSKMQFALLIGRNWLKDEFVVDVGEEEMQMKEKNEAIHTLSAMESESRTDSSLQTLERHGVIRRASRQRITAHRIRQPSNECESHSAVVYRSGIAKP